MLLLRHTIVAWLSSITRWYWST